jgi:glyoxylase-like metal-dependent hydrolase (beta-lactamase superfamily II)
MSLAASGSPYHLGAQARPPGGDGVDSLQVRPNVHVIVGAGGNIVLHVGADGVVLVDTGAGEMTDRVLAEVREITAAPIRLIINTSADRDHIGGNERISQTGVNIFSGGGSGAAVLAHENVLNRISAPTGQEPLFPVGIWPTDTYISKIKSMYLNDDGVQVIHLPSAHSDGDSIVFFRRADVVVTGDIVDMRRFPVIDVENGGSIQGELDALNALLDLAVPPMPLIYKEGRTFIVPGHGRIADQADVVEYRDMVTVIRDRIRSLIDKGMTLEQIKAANPTQGYRARYGSDTGSWTTDMFVEAVFRGLTPKGQS